MSAVQPPTPDPQEAKLGDTEWVCLKGDHDGAHFEIMTGGAIKIEVGGSVHVRTAREWHALAVASFARSEIERTVPASTWEESNRCYLAQFDRAEALQKALDAKQAELDRVMLEHCPDEMTAAQTANWARHQRPVNDPHDKNTTPRTDELTAKCEGLSWDQAGPQYQALAEFLERELAGLGKDYGNLLAESNEHERAASTPTSATHAPADPLWVELEHAWAEWTGCHISDKRFAEVASQYIVTRVHYAAADSGGRNGS